MLVLASGSPRRQVLLERAGIAFRVEVSQVAEEAPARGDARAVAERNARRKAERVAGDLVLGADTVVALGEHILGKPRDAAHATDLLRALSGTTHSVVTGVALKANGVITSCSVETRVTMREIGEEEIAAYVSSGEGMGKAGGYAIQESAERFVTAVDGPLDNVVGLPVDAVRALLRKAGVAVDS